MAIKASVTRYSHQFPFQPFHLIYALLLWDKTQATCSLQQVIISHFNFDVSLIKTNSVLETPCVSVLQRTEQQNRPVTWCQMSLKQNISQICKDTSFVPPIFLPKKTDHNWDLIKCVSIKVLITMCSSNFSGIWTENWMTFPSCEQESFLIFMTLNLRKSKEYSLDNTPGNKTDSRAFMQITPI